MTSWRPPTESVPPPWGPWPESMSGAIAMNPSAASWSATERTQSLGPKISAVQAQQAALSKDDPQYAALGKQITTMQGQRTTLFNGETLRSSLLNAYGWWTIGTYTLFAAWGLLIAALGVLVALAFEIFVAYRKPATVVVPKGTAAAKA